jgi:hypothetical protein
VAKVPRSDDVAGVLAGQDGDIIEARLTDLCFSTRRTAMPALPNGPAGTSAGSRVNPQAHCPHGSRQPAGAMTRVARRRRM